MIIIMKFVAIGRFSSFKQRMFLRSAICIGCLPMLMITNFAFAESFHEALVATYQSNPQLQAQRERVAEVDEGYIQARSEGRLTSGIDVNVGRSLTNSRAPNFDQTQDNRPRNTSLTLNKPLYQGGRVRGLKTQASELILSARQSLRDAQQNTLLAAATAYIDVIRDQEVVAVRKNNVGILKLQLKAANERFSAGAGTRTEIAQARSRLLGAQKGYTNAQADLEISKQAYMRTIGHYPLNLKGAPLYAIPYNVEEARRIARNNNPQLLATHFDGKAAEAAIGVAKSAGKPSLFLNGQVLGSQDQSQGIPDTRATSITAQLRIPLSSGGGNKSRVRAARRAKERLKYELRDSELAADQIITSTWAQIEAAKESLSASVEQAEEAILAFRGIVHERNAGLRTTLDVLNAEQEVLNAKLAIIDDQRNLKLTIYRLLVAMGTFDAPSLKLEVEHYDPQENFQRINQNKLEHLVGYVPSSVRKIGSQLPNIPKDISHFTVQVLTTDALVNVVPEPIESVMRQFPNIPKDIETFGESIVTSETFDKYILYPVGTIGRQLPNIPKDAIEFTTKPAWKVTRQLPNIPIDVISFPGQVVRKIQGKEPVEINRIEIKSSQLTPEEEQGSEIIQTAPPQSAYPSWRTLDTSGKYSEQPQQSQSFASEQDKEEITNILPATAVPPTVPKVSIEKATSAPKEKTPKKRRKKRRKSKSR